MTSLLLNPFVWLICVILAISISSILKSKRRQRDIQKGVEKALKEMEKKK